MGSYVRRPAEVIEQIETFAAASLADLQNQLAGAVEQKDKDDWTDLARRELLSFRTVPMQYYQARNSRLNEMIKIIDIFSARTEEMESRWKEQASGMVSECSSLLSQLLSGIDPQSAKAQALKWSIIVEDARFSTGLAALDVASRWTEASRVITKLQNMMTYLRVGYDTIATKEAEIVQSECSVVQDAESKLRGVWQARGGSDEYIRLADAATAAREVTSDNVSLRRVRTALETIGSLAEKAGSTLAQWEARYAECLAFARVTAGMLEDLENIERSTVHQAFKKLRKEVADVISDKPHERGIALISDCMSPVSDWTSSMTMAGSKADAEEFQGALMGKANNANILISEAYRKGPRIRKSTDHCSFARGLTT